MAIVVFGAAGGLGLSLTKALKQKFNDSTIIAVSPASGTPAMVPMRAASIPLPKSQAIHWFR